MRAREAIHPVPFENDVSYEALLTAEIYVAKSSSLSLGEKVRLLRASTERGLLARRLEAVGLEDALKGLGRRTLAGATATGRHSHGGGGGVSGGGHFV